MISNRIFARISGRLGTLALVAAFTATLGIFTGCSMGPKGPLTVPLEYRPNKSEPLSGSINATDVKVFLEPIADRRQDKEAIGKNNEGSTPVPVYGAGKTPPEFFHDVMEQELKNFGIDFVEAAEAADRVITIELTRFFTDEGGTYKGEVRATASVKDKAGRPMWKGQVAGDGENYGRSLSRENYQQTFSDATRNAIRSLVTNSGFQQALTH
jgi:hypothetical protein